MELKERIQELCKRKNISMNQLEQNLKFGTGYISKLGKSTPNISKIQQIANYFHVSVDYLMTGNNVQNSTEQIGATFDDDLSIIQRERSKMSEKEKAKLMNILKANFDDYNWEEDDSGDIE